MWERIECEIHAAPAWLEIAQSEKKGWPCVLLFSCCLFPGVIYLFYMNRHTRWRGDVMTGNMRVEAKVAPVAQPLFARFIRLLQSFSGAS